MNRLLISLALAGAVNALALPLEETPRHRVPGPLSVGWKAPQDFTSRRIYQTKELGKSVLKVGKKKIPVWLADTDTKRQEGMMWLGTKDVPNGQGMLFLFREEMPQASFWMQNTLIPLDIAYINGKGKVVNVARGKPRDTTSLPSKGPVQYVLELKAGEAKKLGVVPGATVSIPKDLKSKD